MERLEIHETSRKSIQNPPTTETTEGHDEWHGLPFRPNPQCSRCKGAGVVHPNEDGRINYSRAVPCREPGCLYDSVRGNVTREVDRQSFDTFRAVPGAEKALKAARQLASGEAKFVWLLIYGRPGNGKTHLCNAIVRASRDRGMDTRTILAGDLFSLLREAIRDNRTDQLLRRFKTVEFLAIDDYGVEYGSDWERAKFDELMTSRYSTAKPTVLVTNKDLADLPERIKSRFTDKFMAKAVHNSALDYRVRRC